MAEIRRYPWVRHLRSEPTNHVLRYRRGVLQRSGRGISFWFFPMNSAVAEIPVDTRELSFLIHGKSKDFQEVTVQGEIHYRITSPETLGEMIDFSLDLSSGSYAKQPLDQIASLLIGQCQQIAVMRLAEQSVRDLLVAGPTVIKDSLGTALTGHEAISSMGIAVLAVRVSAVSPTPELEKALQTPTREQLQQLADQATFERRALAVEKERAIAENELQSQIELARREETLIEQQGLNERRRAEEEVAASGIQVHANARNTRVSGEAHADRIRMVEGARGEMERERLEAYRDLSPAVIVGMAAQELATKLTKIEHLNITPDLLAVGLNNLLQLGAGKGSKA